MKKLVASLLVLVFVLFAIAPAAAAANDERGGFMGFISGCCFGVRSGAAYNDGKDLHWREWALLAVPVVLVLVVELLNSAVEAAIDRFGPQWHQLSKNAKDMGSAAVLLSIGLCIAIWGAALYERFA